MLDLFAVLALSQACAPSVAPETLTAIAHVESRFDPLAIGVNRAAPLKRRPTTTAEAVETARALVAEGRNIDVGLMQVNLQWHGHRATPDALLDAGTNLDVAAAILAAAIASAPGDPELGIGRYHHWRSDDVARAYGRRVLAVVQALQLRHGAHR